MKTGFVCAAGLNMVATARRNGRDLMAVILGSVSSRERGEEAAQLLLKGFSGELTDTGRFISELPDSAAPAPDLRAQICGKQAKAYVAARAEAFPYGLKDEPSFLNDTVIRPAPTRRPCSAACATCPCPCRARSGPRNRRRRRVPASPCPGRGRS